MVIFTYVIYYIVLLVTGFAVIGVFAAFLDEIFEDWGWIIVGLLLAGLGAMGSFPFSVGTYSNAYKISFIVCLGVTALMGVVAIIGFASEGELAWAFGGILPVTLIVGGLGIWCTTWLYVNSPSEVNIDFAVRAKLYDYDISAHELGAESNKILYDKYYAVRFEGEFDGVDIMAKWGDSVDCTLKITLGSGDTTEINKGIMASEIMSGGMYYETDGNGAWTSSFTLSGSAPDISGTYFVIKVSPGDVSGDTYTFQGITAELTAGENENNHNTYTVSVCGNVNGSCGFAFSTAKNEYSFGKANVVYDLSTLQHDILIRVPDGCEEILYGVYSSEDKAGVYTTGRLNKSDIFDTMYGRTCRLTISVPSGADELFVELIAKGNDAYNDARYFFIDKLT